MMAVKIICIVIISYFMGNFNAAIIISKLSGGDIRSNGSGNPGTMNMIRSYGKVLGAMTLVLDVFKSALACTIACIIMGETPFVSDNYLPCLIAGLSVTIGHILPVFLKFKGGKGIACIIGMNFVCDPLVMTITLLVGILIIQFCQVGTFGTISMIYAPIIVMAYNSGGQDIVSSVLMVTIVVVSLIAHRENIIRLFKGQERLTKLFGKKKKT